MNSYQTFSTLPIFSKSFIFVFAFIAFITGMLIFGNPVHANVKSNHIVIMVNSLDDSDQCDEEICTLRGAILRSNKTTDETERIQINIEPTQKPIINLTQSLPIISQPVTIDGFVNETYGRVQVTIPGAQNMASFIVRSDNVTIQSFEFFIQPGYGNAGVFFSDSDDIVITNNIFYQSQGYTHSIAGVHTNRPSMDSVTISGNQFLGGPVIDNTSFPDQSTGFFAVGINNSSLINNTFSNLNLGMIIVGESNRISGNTFNNLNSGISLSYTFNNEGKVFSNRNLIGGNRPEDRNLFTNIRQQAIYIDGDSNIVRYNLFNTVANGVNLIGSSTSIRENEFTDIGYNAIAVFADGSKSNTIYRNTFTNIGNLPIELGDQGPDVNDPLDKDEGPNEHQNFVEFTGAEQVSDFEVKISGTLHSTPGSQYLIQLYDSNTCKENGLGEGQHITLAFIPLVVQTDGDGNAFFEETIFLQTNSEANRFITATTTDPDGNTSEFSRCRMVTDSTVITDPVEVIPPHERDLQRPEVNLTGEHDVCAIDDKFVKSECYQYTLENPTGTKE